MIGFLLRPWVQWLLAAVAVAGFVLWLRWDAVNDAYSRSRLEQAEERLEDLEDARERREEIESLPDSDLRDQLLDRVQPQGAE